MDSLETLEEQAHAAVDRFRQYDEEIPVTRNDANEMLEEGEEATEEQVHEFLDQNIDFYDQLLNVDSEELRDKFHGNMRYNPSNSRIAKDMASVRNAAFTGGVGPVMWDVLGFSPVPELSAPIWLGGMAYMNFKVSELNSDQVYIRSSETIGIGKDPSAEPRAYKTVASELFHAYQNEHDSDTWTHPFLREGLERAASTRSLEEAGYGKQADAFNVHILVNGYAKAAELAGEEHSLELTESEREALEEKLDSDETVQYNLPAAVIHAAEEEEGREVYSELFDDDYSSISSDLESMQELVDTELRLRTGMRKALEYSPV